MLGWQLEISKKKLHRALDQDKINPQDEVWCVALRRNLLVCGTECGCIILFTNPDSEDEQKDINVTKGKCPKIEIQIIVSDNPFQFFDDTSSNIGFFIGLNLKRGHSIVKLEFDCYRSPVFKQQVSSRPVLAVDLGISDEKIFIYFRTDIQSMSCLVLSNK